VEAASRFTPRRVPLVSLCSQTTMAAYPSPESRSGANVAAIARGRYPSWIVFASSHTPTALWSNWLAGSRINATRRTQRERRVVEGSGAMADPGDAENHEDPGTLALRVLVPNHGAVAVEQAAAKPEHRPAVLARLVAAVPPQ
jgi:hypothetical protein